MHQLFTKAQSPDVPLPMICTRRLFALCTPAWLAEPNISVQIRCTERFRACCDLGKGIRGSVKGCGGFVKGLLLQPFTANPLLCSHLAYAVDGFSAFLGSINCVIRARRKRLLGEEAGERPVGVALPAGV